MEAKAVVKTLTDTVGKKNIGRKFEQDSAKWRPRNCSTRWPTCCKRLRSKKICEKVGDLKGEALVITMHYSLAEAEAETAQYADRDIAKHSR